MQKQSALVVATVSGFIKSFEMNDISILQEMGFTVHIATNVSQEDKELFRQKGLILHQIGFERSPFRLSNFKAVNEIRKIIEENGITMVHCHTPVGGVIARMAAKKYRKCGCKVIYTVHGLQFYRGAPKKDWIIYYPVEKMMSRFCDAIITINHEDHDLVSKKFSCKNVFYIPGVGVDLRKFSDSETDSKIKRKELGINANGFVVLSVGELIERKNHKVVIDAISQLGDNSLYYIIAGKGPLLEQLQNHIIDKGLQDRVFLLGHRSDINELLACSDVFVHSAKREGLPVALMEAMANGVPVVCSKIRGNTDLIEDGKNGILCDTDKSNNYANAIKELRCNESLREKFERNSKERIEGFSISVVDKRMREIYKEVLSE